MIGAIILGIVAGFLGRLLMPGRDPMGFFATVLLGLAGALVGFFIFTGLLGIGDNDKFDLGGLIGAVIGVMVLLGLYRAFVARRTGPVPRGAAAPPSRSLPPAAPDGGGYCGGTGASCCRPGAARGRRRRGSSACGRWRRTRSGSS